MEGRKELKGQEGFTLIEIIAVLIILGILAAVAVPKYLDMSNEAKVKAAQGAIAEIKGRLSVANAKCILEKNGAACTAAEVVAQMDSWDVGSDFTLTNSASGNTVTISVTQFQTETPTGYPVNGTYTTQ